MLFFGVGVLGRIGVCTDETGHRAVVLAVVVLVDACIVATSDSGS